MYYEVGVFGKNIFDKEYIVDAGNSGRNIGFPTFVGGTRFVIGVQAKIGFKPSARLHSALLACDKSVSVSGYI